MSSPSYPLTVLVAALLLVVASVAARADVPDPPSAGVAFGSEVSAQADVAEAPHPVELDLPVDWFELGQVIFEGHCSMCHPLDGGPGVTAFAGPGFVAGSPIEPFIDRPIFVGEADRVLRHMCTFWSGLGDPAIALVVSYLRNAWGHEAHPVDAAMVKTIRDGGRIGLPPDTPTTLKPPAD